MDRIALIERIMALRLQLIVVRKDQKTLSRSSRAALKREEQRLLEELREAWEEL